ncbi:hypothetical protein [Salinimicrobium sediminilitoris]|uniref:hypothetical protein n=1 Tax=Salinimicrobium sediminilitoris TaxID=2876715 RepID=UPI001E46BD36|nr:hypothetical protein [Salinimicrobium sediminilitoris]MCC8358309.1 hypothetical protein [Salinimicrobium sediminilitoris]
MRQINLFFLIGTLGMLFTSMLHVLMAAITSEEAAASNLEMLYPVFAIFLIVGTWVMMKRKQPQEE